VTLIEANVDIKTTDGKSPQHTSTRARRRRVRLCCGSGGAGPMERRRMGKTHTHTGRGTIAHARKIAPTTDPPALTASRRCEWAGFQWARAQTPCYKTIPGWAAGLPRRASCLPGCSATPGPLSLRLHSIRHAFGRRARGVSGVRARGAGLLDPWPLQSGGRRRGGNARLPPRAAGDRLTTLFVGGIRVISAGQTKRCHTHTRSTVAFRRHTAHGVPRH
jgi:hypothetical protein